MSAARMPISGEIRTPDITTYDSPDHRLGFPKEVCNDTAGVPHSRTITVL